MLPSTQNPGGKRGIKHGNGLTNFYWRRCHEEVKHEGCGGWHVKANAENNNFSRVTKSIHQDDFVFHQNNFTVRSYEVDANRNASVETLMNYFQECGVSYFKSLGLQRDGFCTTPEMIKRNLVWVTTQMQILTYRYPKWDEEVQVETWISADGKNTTRCNWLLTDFKTNEVLATAFSSCALMNKLTRRLSKFPEEVRREIESYYVNNSTLFLEKDSNILPKLDDTTANYICSDLKPAWSDIDVNLHVNNVKYIDWVLESIPRSILMKYELCYMTLKFKRECGIDTKLHSLAAISTDNSNNNNVEYNHMLLFEDGVEILRGRTQWRPKATNNL
ncbi:hypothetical protein PIB30_016745 [Stylosanthes scabra]|uniref:Acyl-[acyl-carrier-protein] hydrolase n=1 Tax=Stylosanthes scabra TaxID=79078 RepID=A0ABU6Z5T1_9FABA|nr:hypothetical protein [Stylosanthes scabra]